MSVLNGVISPTVRVEYDSALPLGPKDSPSWVAISPDVIRSISIRRGKTQENQLVQPGECTVTFDNRSGDFDPMNDASPYWFETLYGGMSFFSTHLGIRVVATWNSVDYVLYTGFLEQLMMDYGLNPTATITCVDVQAFLAQQQLLPISAPTPAEGNGDPIYFRCERILDRIAPPFPVALRGLDTSVDNTLYGTRYGSDALGLLQAAADCQPARLFVDSDGLLRLLRWDGGDVPGVLLSDDPTDVDAIGYDLIDVDPGSRYLLNSAVVSKVDGDGNPRGTVVSTVTASLARFGLVQQRYELGTNTAAPVASFLANQYAEPFDRVRRISFSMANLGTNFPKVLVMELADYVSVERTTYDGRSLSFECNVEGIEYDISPNEFRAAYTCSTLSAMPTPTGTYWFGLLGYDSTNTLGYRVHVDASDNVYGVGTSYLPGGGSPTRCIQVAKTSSDGVLQAQNAVAIATTDIIFGNSTLDSSNNLIVVGSASVYSGPGVVIKFDSSLDVVWQKTISGSSSCKLFSVFTDSSGNIYVGGSADSKPFIAKLDSSGVVVWQKTFDVPLPNQISSGYVTGLSVVGSTVYAVFNTVYNDTISNSYRSYWLQLDTDGVLGTQRQISSGWYFSGNDADIDPSLTTDNAGNSFIVVSGSPITHAVMKISSLGVIAYAKEIVGYSPKIASVDSDGNCYFSYIESAANQSGKLLKVDPDGDLLWARGFKRDGASFTHVWAQANNAGELCVAGYGAYTGVPQEGFMAFGKVPANGTRTGSYPIMGLTSQTMIYSAETITLSSVTLTTSVSPLTAATSSATVAASSFSENYFTHFYANVYI